jgi:hypothetical protein
MRRALFGILMAATAAMPIAAQAQDRDRTDGRAERAAARAERSQEHYRQQGERNQARSDQRVERQQVRQERVAPAQQQQSWAGRRSGGDGQRSQSWSGRGGQDNARREAYRRQIEESRAASQRSADQTIGGNYARQAERNQQRYEQNLRQDYRRDNNRGGDWNRGGRDGRNDRWSDNRGDRGSWNRGWRNDNRYDWQRYRYSNRDRFRAGSYYSPYRGYGYNRLSIGLILDSLFYSNRYWLNDPYQYRLPAAPYGTQWVRYYNDVVLVDVYTGEVVDVIYDFFW